MKLIQRIKLQLRANRYKNKYDKGGIAYIMTSVQPGQTALDIGAHKGSYTYFLRKQVGHNGSVYAFEPQSELYNYLNRIKEWFVWDNVTIEHLALSDVSDTATLYIPTNTVSKGSSPGATIVEQKGQADASATQTVSTDTLDAYCQRHSIKPGFLKVDVEGNELKVFQGGIGMLQECKPKILVEIEARHVGQERVLETFSFLESLGYKGYFLNDLHHVPLSAFRFDRHQDVSNMKAYCNNFVFE